MVIGEIDSWIHMLECIAYNFFHCALKFNSKYFTFDHSLERNNSKKSRTRWLVDVNLVLVVIVAVLWAKGIVINE